MQREARWSILLASVLAVIWVLPIVGIVITSLRPNGELVHGWWSTEQFTLTLDSWRAIWSKYPIAESFFVTLELAAVATAATMILTPAAAYAFHFLEFKSRRLLLIIIINGFVLPQQVVIIPLFRLWREMGMIDNAFAVLIPYVGLSFAWSIFLVKNFLEDFPKELIEASRIDGCGPMSTFFHVVLPNSLSPVFAAGILQFLWTWNSLLLPLLFLRTGVPLPVVFARISGGLETNWSMQAVAAIVTTIVPLIVFIVFQRQFAGGSLSRSGSKE